MLFLRSTAISDVTRLVTDVDALLLSPLFLKYSRFPRGLVHYTSIDALGAIVSSGNLRMSHFGFLNDSTEVLHGRRIADELMAAEIDRGDETSEFFHYCRFAAHENADLVQYFLSSFSVLPDDAELWRRYGDRGTGVAIAFDTRRMGSEVTEPYSYHIGRVTYRPAEQLELISALFEATKTVLRDYVQRHGYDVRDAAVQMLAVKLGAHLVHHAVALKSAEWNMEQEWRTVFSLLDNDPAERHARVQFRSDGRPFVDVRVRSTEPDSERMPIVRVLVGQFRDSSRVRAVLDSSGYEDVPVVRSSVKV